MMWYLLATCLSAAPPDPSTLVGLRGVQVRTTDTPTFSGASADVALATQLWPVATRCAGRSARTHTTVPIERVDDLGAGVSGRAFTGAAGLVRIGLLGNAPPIVMAHELGHAWFYEGALGLSEGRAEVIARCVALALPDLRFGVLEGPRKLVHLPDLRSWDPAAVSGMDALRDLYTAARRLFVGLDGVIPREKLLDPKLTTWESFDTLLREQGQTALADDLLAGAPAQRSALSDLDGDALTRFEELRLGTDPDRRDSDDDGWWDGAPAEHPPGAVPLDFDGSFTCLPSIPNTTGYNAELRAVVQGVVVETVQVLRTPNQMEVSPASWRARSGGMYVVPVLGPESSVDAPTLYPNPYCTLGPGWAVVSATPFADGALSRLGAEIPALRRVLAERSLLPKRRLQAQINNFVSDTVELIHTPANLRADIPRAVFEKAAAAEALAALAAVLLASQTLYEAEDARLRSPGMALALAESLVPQPRGWRLLAAPPVEIKTWQKVVAACPTGWSGLIAGDCR